MKITDVPEEDLSQFIHDELTRKMLEKLAPYDAEFDRRVYEGHPYPEGAYDEPTADTERA